MNENNNKPVINYAISGVLAIAVIILFVLFFTNKPAGKPTPPPTQTQLVTLDDGTVVEHQVPFLPIAYIQSDSIYTTYKFFINESSKLQDKYSSEYNNLQSRARKIQQDINQFQQDMQNNRYLTQAEAEQKGISLQRREEELQRLASQMEQDQMTQRQALSAQLVDSIKNVIDILNLDKKYQIIFLNEGLSTILYADSTYDLTAEALELLNSRYSEAE